MMAIVILTIILGAAITLLITQWIRFELTALLIIVALAMTGLLTPTEALSGFANEATLTVASMFVLSAGLIRTGALDFVFRRVTRTQLDNPRKFLFMLAVLTVPFSAFLNNTPVVVLLIPVVLGLCQRNKILPSKVMIPLSFFGILGGTLTLIGTSTNILVDNLYRNAGGEGFGMFEFTPMGLCYLALGGTFIILASDRLLPKRKVLSQLLKPHHRMSFVTEIVILEPSKLVGKTLGDLMSGVEDLQILELVRGENVEYAPNFDSVIQADDSLLIKGSPQAIHRLLEKKHLDLGSAIADSQRVKISRVDLVTVEAVITPNSDFFNQRLSDIGLNRLYGIKVLAVQRMGRHLQTGLRALKLQEGDLLLIQGEEGNLKALEATGSVLIIEGVDKTIRFSRRAPVAIAILVGVVVPAAFGWLPLSILAFAGGVAMILFRCLRFAGALRALDSSILFLLAGTIPLGIAMEKTGMAELVARSVIDFSQDFGPMAMVGAIYLVTSILTAFLTNTTAAILLVPIVLQIATDTGIDAKPLLVAVTFGASASFLTPIGYQTNLLVMGPGGYLFRDYFKIGVLLNLVLWIAATVMIPWFWPFY